MQIENWTSAVNDVWRQETTIPPFNDLTAPLEDTKNLDEKGKPKKNKDGQFKIKEGYCGIAKGVAQVLWERGL